MGMKLTIGRKLILAVVAMLVLVATISIVGIRSIDRVGKGAAVILRESSHLDTVQELRLFVEKVLMPANDYLIHGDIEERANFERLMKKLKEQMAETSKMIIREEHAAFFAEEEEELAKAAQGVLKIESLARKILSLSDPIGNPEGAKMMEEMDAIADSVSKDFDVLLNFFRKDAAKAMEIADAAQTASTRATIMIGVIIIFVGLIGGLLFARGITKPVGQLVQATQKISAGDLTARAEISSRDEIGELATSFNKMTEDLKKLMEKEKELAAAAAAAETDRKRATELEKAYKELRETQAKLIQAGKMAAMGTLGAGIAHQLNQPLAGIRGFAQLVLMQMDKKNPFYEDLKKIEDQTGYMRDIITNISGFARTARFKKEPIDINEPIEKALQLFSEQIRLHGIKLVKNLDPKLPKVNADANQMQQVFVNFITNSREVLDGLATGAKKELAITSQIASQKLQVEGKKTEAIEIIFSDTGPGIADEIKDRIFEPFFTTKGPKSTGLGLALNYGMIQDHGGVIEFDSSPGKGTTFVVKLPTVKSKN